MEGMRMVKAKVNAIMHPSRAADVPQGVHEILNSLLFRFSGEFDGVVLAYLAPKLHGKTAKILSGLYPYFHVNLTANLLLFSPAPGMKILGKVNKIEKDYISVLVLGLFNATIGVDDIRKDLKYSTANHFGGVWISSSDDRHRIELGSLIRFSVKSLQETERIIDIRGSLLEDSTGCVDWLEQLSFPMTSKGSKEVELRYLENGETKDNKRKHRKEPNDVQETGQSLASPRKGIVKAEVEEPLIAPKHQKKKLEHNAQEIEQSLVSPRKDRVKADVEEPLLSTQIMKKQEHNVQGVACPRTERAEADVEEPLISLRHKRKKQEYNVKETEQSLASPRRERVKADVQEPLLSSKHKKRKRDSKAQELDHSLAGPRKEILHADAEADVEVFLISPKYKMKKRERIRLRVISEKE